MAKDYITITPDDTTFEKDNVKIKEVEPVENTKIITLKSIRVERASLGKQLIDTQEMVTEMQARLVDLDEIEVIVKELVDKVKLKIKPPPEPDYVLPEA